MTVVYFVQAETEPKLIKIGAAKSLTKSLADLYSANAGALHVLGTISSPDATRLERRLHHNFAALRHHGEWFRPEPNLLLYIRQHTQPLEEVVHEPATWDGEDPIGPSGFISAAQLATLLHVSVPTIRRGVRDGSLPCMQVGGQLRFDAADVLHHGMNRIRLARARERKGQG